MTFPFSSDEAWALTPLTLADGTTYHVRRISGEQLDTARDRAEARKQKRALDMLRELGADGMRELQSVSGASIAAATEYDALTKYDATLLVRFGVAGWGFTTPDGAPVPCDEEWKSKLDAATRDELARGVASVNIRRPGE